MIYGPVLLDTGPLVALLSRRDHYHARCTEWMQELPDQLYSCWPVVSEAAYLIRRYGEGLESLLSRIALERMILLPLEPADMRGIGAILKRYQDQDLDFTDACLMHLAEREGIDRVLTIDHRHFGIFRKADGRALQLHPASII